MNKSNKTKKIIVVDPERCLICRTCELQCATEHSRSKKLAQAVYEKPLPQPRVKVEAADELGIPLQCRHCEDAPCVKICPTKATTRPDEDGPVLIKDERCIGCKWCILVCPFGVICMDRDGKAVTKCDLCFERLKEGNTPACVEGCPTGALQFKSVEEVIKGKRKEYMVRFKKNKEVV